MAISFDKVKAGDVLYDVHRTKMGNTRMRAERCWPVQVVSIDHERGTAVCSWNGNPARQYTRRQIARLRRTPKETAR
jgi:hypothetical protein